MKWLLSLATVCTLGLALLPAVGQAATAGGPVDRPGAGHVTGHLTGHQAWLPAPVSVDFFSQPSRAASPTAASHALPFRPRAAQTTSRISTVSRPASVAAVPALSSAPKVLTQMAEFPLLSDDAAVAALGLDQAVEPPDTMMAAGPSWLLETVNSSASIWSKTGSRLVLVDFNKFLPMPAGFVFSDPRVLYDTGSGRFFFSGVGFNPLTFDSVVFLGVSKTAGGFFVYKVAQTNFGELHDQPKIGVSDDKVVISWNEYCCGAAGTFRGAETFVFQKSTLLTGSTTPVFFVGPNMAQFSPVPVQSLTPTTTEYVAFNGGTFTGVLTITGTPAANNVVITETDLPTPATSTPPNAMQPGGTIATNDDRFLSAVWQSNVLWVTGNTGCMPAGSATRRACMRLVQVATSALPPTLTQAFDLGANGIDLYFPAVTLDAAGDLFMSLSASAATVFGSAALIEINATAPHGTISAAKLFQAGSQHYGGGRWGDYSAISVDPATGAIWATGEYAPTGSAFDWGTATAEFAAGPVVYGGAWTVYHYDNAHTGYDPTAPTVVSVGPTAGWSEATLDAEVYAEPLVSNGLVYAATLNNTMYALDQATGAVVWVRNLGPPVTSGWQCGNVSPQGILGTPVIDAAAGRIYAAAAFSSDHTYRVFGLDLSTGAIMLQTAIPASIGTGFDWTVQQQRGALAVANGYVYVPLGGRAGDCGSYHGWVVGVPTNGSPSLNVYETPDLGSGLWAAGGVVADDTTGNVFVTTGNGVATGCTSVNQNDAVIRLSSGLVVQDYFMPQDWQANWCNNDADLGSASPLLISPSLLFQAGKWGQGFLLNPAALGQVDGQVFPTPQPAAYAGADVCLGNHSDATFGSFAYAAPFVYLECEGKGVVALNLDTGVPSFTPCSTTCGSPNWQAGGGNTFGPPIVAGGAVWAASNNGLTAFNAATGVLIYQSAAFGVNRFVTPSEAGGQVFVPSHLVIKSFSFGL